MTAEQHEAIEANDPTRSGSLVPTTNRTRLSQNEIEQLCLKAARGAGMSWGLAEEAGFAAAWLATRGLDGPSALLAQLRVGQGRSWREICPMIAPGRFRAADGGCLCPIALGAALCDHARLPETSLVETAVRVGPVDHPVLLLPFLADFARTRREGVRLVWSRGAVLLTAEGGMFGDAAALAQETRLDAALEVEGPVRDDTSTQSEPLLVSAETLGELNSFALRTTVPTSEVSRTGAGAAIGDND